MQEINDRKDLKRQRTVSIISLIIFLIFLSLIAWRIGVPMIKFVSEPEKFRLWVESHGILGQLSFIAMTVLQVLIAIIPGEPLEIGAGYAFGAIEGTILCIIGNLIGGILIFALVRTLGIRFVELFYPREKILSLKFLQDQRKVNALIYIVFLMPGTPKDLLSYFAGLTNMKWPVWIIITSLARIPSIVTSTVCGGALGSENYITAIIALVITVFLSGVGFLIYHTICNRNNKK